MPELIVTNCTNQCDHNGLVSSPYKDNFPYLTNDYRKCFVPNDKYIYFVELILDIYGCIRYEGEIYIYIDLKVKRISSGRIDS